MRCTDYSDEARIEREEYEAKRAAQDREDELDWFLASMYTLAENIKVGAALCWSFSLGRLSYNRELFSVSTWRPGCGQSAP